MEINKEKVRKHFRRSMGSYDENARVQKVVVERLCPMATKALRHKPRKILEVGCGTGLLTALLRKAFPDSELHVNDLVEDLCYRAAVANGIPKECCFAGDIERVELPGRYDLVVSASTFQWFTDPVATFRKFADSLNEDGCMVFSSFGKHNLREIRETTGGGLAYRTKEELRELLNSCFDVEWMEEEFHVLEFDNPLLVLQHLKRTGVNVSADHSVLTKGRVNAFIGDYNARFATGGKVPLTYHPLYFVCRRKQLKIKEALASGEKSKIEI